LARNACVRFGSIWQDLQGDPLRWHEQQQHGMKMPNGLMLILL
jgi:hypothetical protein